METSDNGLPAGVADAVLNSAEIARALNKSEPTITKWMAEGMPVLTDGTNGKPYEFQLSACWRWLQDRERVEAERNSAAEQAVQQMRLALIGGNDFTDGERALSPRQRQEAYDAERAFMMAAAQRQELVRRADVVIAFEEVFVTLRDALTALPDRLEREVGLQGKALDRAIKLCDDAISEAQLRVSALSSGEAFRQAAE